MTDKRRPKGQGGVYQRKRDGRWYAKVPLPDPTGPDYWYRYCTAADNSEARAQTAWVQMLSELAANRRPPDDRVTVAEWLTEWLTDVVEPRGVAGTTRIRRQSITRLIPLIGQHRLARLDAGHIQRALNTLATHLAPQTVVNAYQALHVALNVAVAWKRRPDNPADEARPPRVPRAEVVVLSEAEAARVVVAARDERLGPLLLTALAVGVRRGEATGLRLRDLDLERGTLHVHQQIQWVSGQGAVVIDTKGHDRRTLRLPAALVVVLRDHLLALARARASGRRWEEHGLLFPSTVGTPLRPSVIQHALTRILTAAAAPRLSIHGLRHSCATLLLAQGVPEPAIVELLGHSSPALLHRTYGHVLETMRQESALAMDRVFSQAPRRPAPGPDTRPALPARSPPGAAPIRGQIGVTAARARAKRARHQGQSSAS
jgi:integrase